MYVYLQQTGSFNAVQVQGCEEEKVGPGKRSSQLASHFQAINRFYGQEITISGGQLVSAIICLLSAVQIF